MERGSVQEQALQEIQAADTPQVLQEVRVKYLGKKGLVSLQLKGLGNLPPDERRQVG